MPRMSYSDRSPRPSSPRREAGGCSHRRGLPAVLTATLLLVLSGLYAAPAPAQTAPTVTNMAVTSTPQLSSDTYGAYEQIEITLTFSAAVNVAGTPHLVFSLGTGNPSAEADYTSGSGTTQLVFAYTVLPTDEDNNGIFLLDGTDDNALVLGTGGAIIATADNTAASLSFGGRGRQDNHKVDGSQSIFPTISTVAVTSTPTLPSSGTDLDTYGRDAQIALTVTFDKAVTVTGTVQATLEVGSDSHQAEYASGSGTTQLVFAYTVGATDSDTDGIAAPANLLAQDGDASAGVQGGGTLQGTNGQAARLVSAVLAAQTSHKVDGTRLYNLRLKDTSSDPEGDISIPSGAAKEQVTGTVELYHAGQWQSVCDDQWENVDAGVVCRQLGYAAGTAVTGQSFGTGQAARYLLDDVHCAGTETSLFACPHTGLGVHNCGSDERAGVTCHDTATPGASLIEVSFGTGFYSFYENAGDAKVAVRARTAEDAAQPTTDVRLTVFPVPTGTATAGQDYTVFRTEVVFRAADFVLESGRYVQQVEVPLPLHTDDIIEKTENFQVRIETAGLQAHVFVVPGSTSAPRDDSAEIHIRDASEDAQLSVSSYTTEVDEGDEAVVTLSVDKEVAFPFAIVFTTVAGTARENIDYTRYVEGVQFAGGQRELSITLQTLTDTALEDDETFHFQFVGNTLDDSIILQPLEASGHHGTITIKDRTTGVQWSVTATPEEVAEAGGTWTLTVGPAEGWTLEREETFTLDYHPNPTAVAPGYTVAATPGTDFIYAGTLPATLVLNAADPEKETETFTAVDDSDDEAAEWVVVGLQHGGRWVAGQGVAIVDDEGQAAPDAPTGLRGSPGNGQVTLQWTRPAVTGNAPIRYQYRQSSDEGTTWDPDWTDIPASHANTTRYTVPALDNGTLYTFEVRAVSSTGEGPASEQATATPAVRRQSSGGGGGGGGGGDGGDGGQDQHGNTPAQATTSELGASTAGQINTADDVDYFRLNVPQAGVLVVGTTGSTATRGTVWQDGVELATAASGGERQNFQLHVRVAAGEVEVAVTGRPGSYILETTLVMGYLENPGPDSFQSGVGVLSGWVCEAEGIEIEIGDFAPQDAAYGTERLDTATAPDGTTICGDTDNGFGLLFNWNRLGDGVHEVVALVDGVPFGPGLVDGVELGRATVTVTTLGEEFVRGAAGTCTVEDFPMVDESVMLLWQQPSQNFVMAAGSRPSGENRAGMAGVGRLENPGPNSFQSGVGVISGWVCEAAMVEITLGDLAPMEAGYGTERLDTEAVCGDTDNGFGLLFNWNRLGDGEHLVVATVDDVELGRAMVRVTTLGAESVRDVEGECLVEDFPMSGQTVTLEWQQSQQNFVITGVE